MPFNWTQQRALWFAEASEYTGFHKQLAQNIAPFIGTGSTVGDFGCGLGRLDLYLAAHAQHITCMDTEPLVLDILQRDAKQRQIKNISTLLCDATEVKTPFDIVLMSFFGYPPKLMLHCMSLAAKRLIRVVNVQPQGAALQPEKHHKKRETPQDIAQILDNHNLTYSFTRHCLEFGQPLRNMEQAAQFVAYNAPGAPRQEIQTYLEEHLQQTGNSRFPLYLPGKKEVGIFVVETGG